ncbi:MAG: thioredoxin [Fibrobacter sp.]|uniref:thioredoxin n=1 Tax=Fibrobacter sp. TaxID=35828 RepID=UPI002A90A2B3|nr:thioredoxin [Fibrobacter sp.]MDY6265114.1 thioredoxin [Fibrobacter sp.]
MSEKNITKNNFEQEVLHSDKPVLIDFWAPWCGPCRMLSPVISEIAEEYGDKVKVCKVNVDDEGELAASFNVMSIPTLVVVKDGKVTNSAVGVRPKAQIVEMIG